MKSDHPALRWGETVFAYQPLRIVKGLTSAFVLYPFAEKHEGRQVSAKLAELRAFYKRSFKERQEVAVGRLVESLQFAGANVPYYRDLFSSYKFDPEKLRKDARYLEDLPYLTKDIIREQGERLLSTPLADAYHITCKTGGSTGLSAFIYYDQIAADYSSAVTLYGRAQVGNYKFRTELHFACRFPDMVPEKWPSREDLKCFAMNRTNIFFDRLDDVGLEEIWTVLKRRRPYMVHAHPSTIYALACHIERTSGTAKAFDVFESSGELLEAHQRETIARALRCRVVDRYGLAELGVMAYEFDPDLQGLRVFESEGWPESRHVDGVDEIVFTGFRNRLMPLIRYATGDRGRIEQRQSGFFITDVVGRIHDVVPINGVPHATHHIQDILDHRVGAVQEFQIDLSTNPPILKIVPEAHANPEEIAARIENCWPGAFDIQFVGHNDFILVGHRAKFRHVVNQ